MSLRGKLFALFYDRQMAKTEAAGLAELRRHLLAGAAGRVLEIGAGTGANLAYYGPEVTELTLTEPEAALVRRIERRAATATVPTTILRAPAEDLPFPDASFDVAVSTLVLCGVDDQPRALRQLARVLRPGGTLLFLEHVRGDDARLAKHQDHMNPVSRFVVGCECNRPTLSSIEAVGFVVTEVDHREMPKSPSFVRPLIVGRAELPAARGSSADATAAASGAATR